MKSLKQNQGSALITVLALIAVSMTVVTVSVSRSSRMDDTVNNSRLTSSRDSIVHEINISASLPATIRQSLRPSISGTDNTELRNCILGTGPGLCQGDGITEFPLSLYSAISTSASPQLIAGPGPFSQPGARAALYDGKGIKCVGTGTAATGACPFEVYTTFTAQCAGAAPCATAQSIQVKYTVRSPLTGSGVTGSSNVSLATVANPASLILVSNILPPPPGQTLVLNRTTLAVLAPSTDADAATIALANQYGITNPDIIHQIYDQHITDPLVLDTIASSWNSEHVDDVSLAVAAVNTGVTDLALLTRMTIAGSNSSTGPGTGADAITATGDIWKTNADLAEVLMYGSAAIGVSRIPEIITAIQGVTDNTMAMALASAAVTDAAFAQAMVNDFNTAGITDQRIMTALAFSHISDPAQSAQINANVLAAGIDNAYMIELAVYRGATDLTQMTEIHAMEQLPVQWGNAFQRQIIDDILLPFNSPNVDQAAFNATLNAVIASGTLDPGQVKQSFENRVTTAAQVLAFTPTTTAGTILVSACNGDPQCGTPVGF